MTDGRARIVSVVFVVAVIALGGFTFSRLRVETEITHFLPESEDRELAAIARDLTGSTLNRSITLLVRASDEPTTIAAAQTIARRLERATEVETVRTGGGEAVDEAFYALYFERRTQFYLERPGTFEETLGSHEAIRAVVADLKARLRSPMGTFIRQIAPQDPLLMFVSHLDRMRAAQQGGLTIHQGQLLTDDGAAVVFATNRSSPFDSEASVALESVIAHAISDARIAHGPEVSVEQSAVHRVALASERSIREDVTRISIFSAVGVICLILGVFRSFRYLLLSTVPLAAGFIAGLAVTQLAFGQVHGLSLAFGATLIGIAIDYVAHALNHHTLAPSNEGPVGSLKKIMPGLSLGAATTVAGLAGLAWTSFPGIRELAVLTSVGVAVALFVTRYVLAPWLPKAPTPTGLHLWLSERLGSLLQALTRRRAILLAFPAVAILVAGFGLSRLRWVDDIRALNTFDEDLMSEDERVRDAVSQMDAGRLVVALGQDDDEALAVNDAIYRALDDAEQAGELEGFRSVFSFLRSAETQNASHRALSESATLRDRVREALEVEGFVVDGFAPFFEELDRPTDSLSWEQLADSPLGPLVRSFRAELRDGRVAFVTLTRGADLEALDARLRDIDGARVFDQTEFLGAAYGGFRTRTLELIGVGLIAVFAMVFVRYRDVRRALAAFVPAVLAAAASLGALALMGYTANLMHVTALLLVLSMGVDYGVFMVESSEHPEGPAPTVVSLLIACASTVLSFGLLAMSDNPALRALGLVSGLGVLFSLLLAPTAWLLLTPRGTGAGDSA